MTQSNHPFAAGVYNGVQTYVCSVDERVARARSFDRAQCEAALRLPDLQKTVLRAVQTRLRQLDRAAGAPRRTPNYGGAN